MYVLLRYTVLVYGETVLPGGAFPEPFQRPLSYQRCFAYAMLSRFRLVEPPLARLQTVTRRSDKTLKEALTRRYVLGLEQLVCVDNYFAMGSASLINTTLFICFCLENKKSKIKNAL